MALVRPRQNAGVAELADAPDSKSGALYGHGGSTPPSSTRTVIFRRFCVRSHLNDGRWGQPSGHGGSVADERSKKQGLQLLR